MDQPVYKRVLLKISGEALSGDKGTGLDFEVIGQVCDVIKECVDMGVQVGIVVGGGNFWRACKNGGGKMERTRADHMGMLATVMNCLAVADVCEQKGIPVRVQTAMEMQLHRGAVHPLPGHPAHGKGPGGHLRRGHRQPLLLHGHGGGAAGGGDQRRRYPPGQERGRCLLRGSREGSHRREVRQHQLRRRAGATICSVMDSTATSLSMDNHIPVLLFALKDPRNILRVLRGEKIGTIVKE